MDNFSIDTLMDYLPRIIIVLIGPILAHIVYAIFARRKPTVALFSVSAITLIWMIFAAPQSYGQGLGTYSNSAVSVYVVIATGFLWFAHHQLIQRSTLKPSWFFHIPIVLLFIAFCMLLWKFHLTPIIRGLS